jgi:alpha-beta hydrolase superfamily lysophospholipase
MRARHDDQGKAITATPDDGDRTLVVLLHAYKHRASHLAALERLVLEHWPKAAVFRPDYPASTFSMADPNAIVRDLLDAVDARVAAAEQAGAPLHRIVLAGHSLGALLARKLYVVACGETDDAPFEAVLRGTTADDARIAPRAWAGMVDRIVLLAGMNRGWRLSHHISLKLAPMWAVGSLIAEFIHIVSGRWPLICTIRRGAEFITQLRIQWLAMRRRALRDGATAGRALTVQLLGSRDDMVAPEDNVDLVSGQDFVYVDVPFSGHADVIETEDPHEGAGRREKIALALRGSEAELKAEEIVPSDEKFSAPDEAVEHVAFVIHGIRDRGYWTHKIARRIRSRAKSDGNAWATETSSYGYFPMLPFLFTRYRRRKVEWLMDQYAEARARYPNARFSYVGHSNGTYLLAKAMALYPCCRFERVVFAGSVVPRRYDWRRRMRGDRPQVGSALNFVATGDWVVAFFPKLFQLFGSKELGSAGHDGFVDFGGDERMREVRFVEGGHDAAIREQLWDVIADFVVSGRLDPARVPNRIPHRSEFVKFYGSFPPLVWYFIVLVLTSLWLGIVRLIEFWVQAPYAQGALTGFALAGFLLLLWKVATRV